MKQFHAGSRRLPRVVAEARAVAEVRSDHVVRILDVVALDGRAAIVMEPVGRGDSLATAPTRSHEKIRAA